MRAVDVSHSMWPLTVYSLVTMNDVRQILGRTFDYVLKPRSRPAKMISYF